MEQNRSSSLPPKRRFYLRILLAEVLAGSAVTLLAWLQKWTPLRAPHWLYATLFWVGVLSVLIYGIILQRRNHFLSHLSVLLSAVAAIGLAWLFPETLAPGCGGMPRAFAHWENQCTTTCTTVCTWWVPLSDPTCAAQPHQPWDIGCCWTYGQSCTTSCNNVWVDDPPTVSGAVSCSTSGNNSWCRGGAALDLTASDPQKYPLTVSGDIGGISFSCSGSCSQILPDGSGSASFTAVAAGGGNLSSSTGSASYQVDSTSPSLALAIPAPNGSNGWFSSGPVTATASATDSTSGVASVSINGGIATFTASSDGVYLLTAGASDNAGNSTSTSGTIQIDSVPPSLSASASPADGNGGWYVSPAVVTATVSDATSGVADVQVRVDGGSWQDGSIATISTDSSHTVEFQAWDRAGNTAHATVTVQVPTPSPTSLPSPIPTATPPPAKPVWSTSTPAPLSSPKATHTPTLTPTATQTVMPTTPPLATPTRLLAMPVPTAPVPGTTPKPQPPAQRSVLIWPALGFVAFLAALASASLLDPRPQALRQLAKTLEAIQDQPS